MPLVASSRENGILTLETPKPPAWAFGFAKEGARERLTTVEDVAFDKTGTLTLGKPAVVAIESFDARLTQAQLLPAPQK
jgi:hypothetical protein